MVSVDAGVTARYTYDSNNWRVKKEAGGVVTHYVWEGGQVIAEYEFGGGNTPGAGVRYYEPDRLSTRVITNGSGAVVGTLDQLPFGEEVGTAGESEKHKFTSYERDSETGTDYAVNRQYQNATGRFMRPDPYGGSMSITDPQSFNRYTYVGNDPINSIDPLGLQQDPPLVIDVEDPPPAPQQPIESNDTLVVNTNEPGFFFFFPGFIDRPLLAFVRIDIVIGGFVDAGGGGGDFFTPPVPLVPEPPAAPPQQEPQQPNGAACDKKLAGLFGSEGAVADTGRTPSTLQHSTAGMQRFSDHSAEGGVMHLYTNAQGTVPPNSVGLYVPAGFSAVPGGRGTVLNPPGGVRRMHWWRRPRLVLKF